MAYQRDYLAHILLVIHQLLVNIICARCIVQSRVKKGLFDKLNSKRGIGKCIDEHEQDMENVEQIPDHQVEQWVLHHEHERVCIRS